MQQFVLRHESGVYLSQDLIKGWQRTKDSGRALRLTEEKAKNVRKSNIRPEEQGEWKIVPEPAQTEPYEPDWGTLLTSTGETYRGVKKYQMYLAKEHSKADLEICDLLHYIEFAALNAAKGYEAYRMLRKALIRRRWIKDECSRTGIFLEAKSEDYLAGRIEKQMNGLEHREYVPRVRKDLFVK